MTVPTSPFTRLAARALPPWWLFVFTGIAWTLVALIVLRFDYTTVRAISILFGIVAVAAGLAELFVATTATGWWKLFDGLLAVVFVAAGVVSFIHPGDTFVGLAAVVSFFLVFAGVGDIVAAISMRHEVDTWWLQVIGGIILVLIGFWAAGSFSLSAFLLVVWTAAFALVRGVRDEMLAFHLRELQHTP